MSLLLLDNYDSFTYNLYDYLLQLGIQTTVIRNDALPFDKFVAMKPSALVLSPGPKRPEDAGLMMDLIGHFYDKIPILGICLGHQAIGTFFGARLEKAKEPVHGKTSLIHQNGHPVFDGLPEQLEVMRYHSLIIDKIEGTGLFPVAKTTDGELMAMGHERYPVFGIQFHPESVLTEYGLEMLGNWAKTFSSEECWTIAESELY